LIQELTVSANEFRLGEVWADILRRPYEYLVRRWNWKSAVTSAILRGAIFFTANLSAGRAAAVGAMLTEFSYRILFSGGVGSITQALRKCEPAWAAALSASVVLPVISHLVEFTVHLLRGTPRIRTSVAASVAFTILSALFNLYVMRRGVLVVGEAEDKTLLQDLAAIPRLIAGFVAAGPLALWRMLRRTGRRPD
jgi:hypothetical protein